MRSLPTKKSEKKIIAEGEVEGEVFARAGKCMLEEDDDARLETQFQSADGTRGQTSGSGCPLVLYWGLDWLLVGPHGGLQLLGGPLKPGLSEDPRSSNLGSGPVGLDLVFSSSIEARSTSLEDPRWVKAMEAFVAPGLARLDDCRGPS